MNALLLTACAGAATGCQLVFQLNDPAASDAPIVEDTGVDVTPRTLYEASVLEDMPLAYWRFGAESEDEVLDTSGNNNRGTYTNISFEPGPIVKEAGVDRAATFGGQSLVGMGNRFGFAGASNFTVETWVRAGENGNNNGIISKDKEEGGSERHGWNLFIVPGGSSVQFERTVDSGSKQLVDVPGALPVNSAWKHVVATYDGTTLAIYVDGTLRDSTTMNNIDVPATTREFVLGGRDGGNAIEFFIGAIDEVAVYNHALAADRIMIHHTVAITP